MRDAHVKPVLSRIRLKSEREEPRTDEVFVKPLQSILRKNAPPNREPVTPVSFPVWNWRQTREPEPDACDTALVPVIPPANVTQVSSRNEYYGEILEYRDDCPGYLALTGAVFNHISKRKDVPRSIIVSHRVIPLLKREIEIVVGKGEYTGIFRFCDDRIKIMTENDVSLALSIFLLHSYGGKMPTDLIYTVV